MNIYTAPSDLDYLERDAAPPPDEECPSCRRDVAAGSLISCRSCGGDSCEDCALSLTDPCDHCGQPFCRECQAAGAHKTCEKDPLYSGLRDMHCQTPYPTIDTLSPLLVEALRDANLGDDAPRKDRLAGACVLLGAARLLMQRDVPTIQARIYSAHLDLLKEVAQ